MNKMKIISFVAIILLIMNLFLPIISNATDEVEEDIEVLNEQEEDTAGDDEKINEAEETELEVEYRSHVQDIGWQEYVEMGQTSGTTGRNLKIEAMNIALKNNSSDIDIKYTTYIQGNGWQGIVSNGEQTGTTGKNLRMEAIKIWLEGTEEYSVMYRTHIQDIGWQDWVYDGEISGNLGDNLKIEAIEIQIVPKKVNTEMSVTYSSHIQDIGWQNTKNSYDISGTTGRNLKIEAMKIELKNALEGVNIRYKTYVEKSGWQAWVSDGEISGTTGKNLKLYGIRIELEGTKEYTVQYRVHVQDVGWMSWVENGAIAGRISGSNKIEAIQIKIVKKANNVTDELGVEYYTYLEGKSANENKMEQNGEISGTTGENRRVEGISIELLNAPENAHIKYKAHVQDKGWMDWVRDGQLAGIIDRRLKVEAVQIVLEGMDEYTVEYKVHVQDIGWTDWYIDGESAGTTGRNLKIEAIQIRIVPKYKRNYKGIDVSKHNGTIDWQKVKNSGIEFAIIRCGYGQNFVEQDDSKFEYNVSECERLGIPYGVYLYSYALNTDNASSEADHVLRLLNGRKPQVGIWLDIEDDAYYTKYGFPTNEMFVNIATTFCEKMKANGYYNVGIYANLYWLNTRLNDSRLDKYDKWVAQWGNQCTYNKDYAMWQYSDSGQVDGISGNVDLDICYKRYF